MGPHRYCSNSIESLGLTQRRHPTGLSAKGKLAVVNSGNLLSLPKGAFNLLLIPTTIKGDIRENTEHH